MITYHAENWSAVVEELKPLLREQWEEIALDRERIPYDPDWDKYKRLEAEGMLHVTTARADGVLVGWYLTVVSPHPHYKTTLFGFLDIYYVRPQFRRSTVGIGLFRAMEAYMRAGGVVELISISKMHRPVNALFERLGWRETGITYTKLLGD